jgi:hypothetical protein
MKPLLRFTADTALALIMGTPCFGQHYMPVNLVSNTAGVARVTDPQLINPWGMSRSPSSAWWVSDQRTGFSTVYNGAGAKQSLIVAIPQADPNQRRCQGNVKTPVKCDTFPGDKQVAHRSLFGSRVWDHGALVHGLTGVLIKNEILAIRGGT